MAERLRARGLRSRLTLSIAAILIVAGGATFVVVYRGTGNTLRARVDRELRAESKAFTTEALDRSRDPDALANDAARYVRAQAFGPSARLLALSLPGGRVVTNDPELLGLRRDTDTESPGLQRREDQQAQALLTAPPGFSTLKFDDIGEVRVLTRPIVRAGRRIGTVRVGEPLASVERAQDGIARAFAVAGSLTLLAALIAGYFVAARTTEPLRRMAHTAAAIDAGDLSHRIGATGPSEEIAVLSEAFDHMLDRLDAAFVRQREFVSDASHELRTPLTIVSGQLEVLARSDDVTPEDVRRVEALVAKEVARMEALVDDLLVLASTDEGGDAHRVSLDARVFLTDQLEALRPTAERRFELGHVDDGTVEADADALARVLRNLTRNAIEHTRPGQRISLSVTARGDRLEFAVEDEGPGIPEEERDHVFERFHRVRPAAGGGSGLGLAIARAIVDAHGGRIWADATATGGGRIAFELPRASPARTRT